MKFTRLVTVLLAIPMCTSVMAANENLTGTFKTIKNVTITEVAGVQMTGLYLASASTCTMTQPTVSVNFPGETVMKMSNATATLGPSTNYGVTPAGASCAGTNGVPGVYEIEGSEGADVTVTLTSGTTSGITFAPVGCVGDYDGSPDGDVCTAVANGGVGQQFTLAATGDQTVSAGNGVPVAGFSYLAIGGQATAGIGLAAATDYLIDFDISVTY
ncbi:hypothetical protein [Brumicola nitratireducens]|uniref:Uncharacterized protein n=1 Tax=Glaciecola nitratireducens (strain JCM 12485 / KCTC 12276 / FR1064) TaxID=1085623 RepID=G4QKQ6_GLANF|nr:hypothetical protein [Glaciecola nitratireducens]AEP30359.1 hypothetical protein GNIT_2258 [Glaciecola nitratireducens FR1064]